MMTLSDIRAAAGLAPDIEPVAKARVILAPSGGPRKPDDKCPRCREVRVLENERVPCSSYNRSVCVGARRCSACGGEDENCGLCDGKGYTLKFETRSFDYACSGCVTEMRRRGTGNGKLVLVAPPRQPLEAQRWVPVARVTDATPRKLSVDPVEPLVLKGVVSFASMPRPLVGRGE